MKCWFTRDGAVLPTSPLKRFDPRHWTVDFPRGTIASLIDGADAHSLVVKAEFLRTGDLVGLIWESEDRQSHEAHRRRTARDYAGCRVSFRWQSSGLIALDQVNGPTLTIEGRDANGAARAWYVRLWNYASGSPTDAVVSLDFDALDGGWLLPGEADPVWPGDIDRMFISLVPPDYVPGGPAIRIAPAVGEVTMSAIDCRGRSSVIEIADTWQPETVFGICTAYDDLYHLNPARIVESVQRLGYRGDVTHYIGMSHYEALGSDGRVNAARGMNGPARAWHEAFASGMAAATKSVIFSLSYEIFDQFCPEDWKQRAYDGAPGLTGWVPPSALVSPANGAAITYLATIAAELVELAEAAGLRARFQIGEPWWWIMPDGRPCLYDSAAVAAFGGAPVEIADIAGTHDAAEQALLDDAGAVLAASTATVAAAAKAAGTNVETLLLAYLPTVLDPDAPDAKRVNLPVGWAKPAFDRLQLEDYDWVTEGRAETVRDAAFALVGTRLGYAAGEQHYLAGFASDAGAARLQWRRIVAAAEKRASEGVEQVFLWALPQVLRDDLVLMPADEEEMVEPFADVDFPIAIGADASVAPGYSTQIVTSASGHEYRNADWAQARLRFDAGPGVRGDAELEKLVAFFRARRGPAQAFRFRDPFDHSSNEMTGVPSAFDQPIGTGNGVTSRFSLCKTYGEGEVRRITRPVAGTVKVAIDGLEQPSGWSLEAGGEIQFDTPPDAGANISAGYLFDVPVRFAEDRLEVNQASFKAGEMPSVPLIEVREDN